MSSGISRRCSDRSWSRTSPEWPTPGPPRWAAGERAPRAEHEQRLRCAYQTFHLLLAEESPHTVRAWFLGLNPQLDDQSPAQIIREGDFRDVLVAAKAFLAGG